jgi:hypothetical protein
MKTAVAALFFLTVGVISAAPTIGFLGGSVDSIIVVLYNPGKEPYFYCSAFVDEVPYTIEFTQENGRKISYGSNSCGTGAVWHRLEPDRRIHVVVRDQMALSNPTAQVTLLVYSDPKNPDSLVQNATIKMSEALEFLQSHGLSKLSEPAISSFMTEAPQKSNRLKPEANQALVPTVTSVTPAAGAPVAPAAPAAHL